MYTFPYNTKTIKGIEHLVPRISLKVKTSFGHLEVRFLIDSGSDTTSLPVHPYVPALGVKLNRKSKTTISGVEGKGVTAYPDKLQFQLGSHNFELPCFFITSDAEPLLGRQEFWKLFSITFDNKKHQTILTPI